jgi:hypothetical protein
MFAYGWPPQPRPDPPLPELTVKPGPRRPSSPSGSHGKRAGMAVVQFSRHTHCRVSAMNAVANIGSIRPRLVVSPG